MRRFTTIVFLFGLFSCGLEPHKTLNNQTGDKQLADSCVSDSTIYSFLNFILQIDSGKFLYHEKIADRDLENFILTKEDSLTISKMKDVFVKGDMAFIYSQLKHGIGFRLNAKFLPDKPIISTDTLMNLQKNDVQSFWDGYRKKFGNGGFHTFSLPLFSKDKSIAIIKTGYHCGSLCGSGGIHIYKKVTGKWICVSSLKNWIS